MMEKIILDMLTQNSVNVIKQQYYDGVELGLPHRKYYLNSTNGREEVRAELPQAQINAIFAVWGDSPLIEEEQANC